MIVKTLLENTAVSADFRQEHGLSLYIETKGHRILFDAGATGAFAENAKKMGVVLADVDYAVLSHGHYDHGGGLGRFLEENQKAKVYVRSGAFNNHLARRKNGDLEEIGLDKALQNTGRIAYTGARFEIAGGVELFSGVTGRYFFSASNRVLLAERNGAPEEDDFGHEQNLIVEEDGKLVLFAGCAHNGIANIMNRLKEIKGRDADFVFGGFHLHNPSANTSEPAGLILSLGEYLKNTGSVFFTGHCTGDAPFELLKSVLGDRLNRLSTGMTGAG